MSGPTINQNGDVISAALNCDGYKHATTDIHNNFSIHRGQIIKVYTIDDSKNATTGHALYTTYDVNIFLPNGSSEIISRCVAVQPLHGGGFNNFVEVLPNDPGAFTTDGSKPLPLRRGTVVLVGFMGGRKAGGVIFGALPHPSSVAVSRRPHASEGTHLEGEFQGLNWKINNDGSIQVTFNGPRDDSGGLINGNGPTSFKIDGDGSVTLTTNADQRITVDRIAKIIVVSNGGTSIISEQAGNKITIQCDECTVNSTANTTVNAGGDATVNATNINANAKANISAQAGGDVSVQSGGNASVKAAKADIQAPSVNVTAPAGVNMNTPMLNVSGLVLCAGIGAGAPAVPGEGNFAGTLKANEVKSKGKVEAGGDVKDSKGTLDAFRQAYDSHTHSGVLPGGGSTGPATPQV